MKKLEIVDNCRPCPWIRAVCCLNGQGSPYKPATSSSTRIFIRPHGSWALPRARRSSNCPTPNAETPWNPLGPRLIITTKGYLLVLPWLTKGGQTVTASHVDGAACLGLLGSLRTRLRSKQPSATSMGRRFITRLSSHPHRPSPRPDDPQRNAASMTCATLKVALTDPIAPWCNGDCRVRLPASPGTPRCPRSITTRSIECYSTLRR